MEMGSRQVPVRQGLEVDDMIEDEDVDESVPEMDPISETAIDYAPIHTGVIRKKKRRAYASQKKKDASDGNYVAIPNI